MAGEKGGISHLEDRASSGELEILEIDHAAEKKLVKKLDRWIIPMMTMAYLLCFLDRSNIGNARLYGLEKDLHMKGNQYQISVSIFFVPYVIFEIPSNLLIKRVGPSRWISFITVSWGIVATLTGICQTYGGLIACRLVLGVFEAGLFPGLAVYLTLFYTKKELALRVGYLFVSAALSGACGGLLAYCIGFLDHHSGLRGWRWIFIIEGIPTFVYGIVAWFLLADGPETAFFLTPEERKLMIVRRERQTGYTKSGAELHKEDVMAAFKDWKIWAFAVGQFGSISMLYGYSVFLPTIIKGLGKWTAPQAQALTIPCYIIGAISYLIVAKLSDSHQLRGPFQNGSALISIIGYIILISKVSAGAHYFACCLIATGLYITLGIPLAWLPTNQPRFGKRTTATALQLTIGNCAGIMAPFLYPTNDGPRYIMGHSVTIAMVGYAACLFAFMSFYFSRVNKGRRAGKEDHKVEGMSEEQINELGDRSPRFMYTV